MKIIREKQIQQNYLLSVKWFVPQHPTQSIFHNIKIWKYFSASNNTIYFSQHICNCGKHGSMNQK